MCSREETHEILSLRLGSLAFSDVGTKALATISERLIFIIPAHQNRPLQILEVPLVANVEYDRSDGTVTGEGIMGGQVKLRLQLRNTGSYILNGLKSAIDQLDLTFATNDGREGFCQCIANSLQNINIGQPDVDKEASKSRPKKQSRAVMIDLSQDVVISGDTQLLSPSLKTPLRVSTSQLIDVSESRESSVSRFRKSSMSPLRESVGRKAAPAQPGEGNRSLLHDTHLVQQERHHHRKLGVETNSYNRQSGEALHNVGVVSDPKELAEYSVAPARPGSDSQKRSMAETTEGHLPQQMHSRGLAEIRPPGAASNLQHLALDALHHSENPFTATLTNTDLIAHSEGGSHSSSAAQPGHSTPRSLLPPSALANSGRRIAPKPASNKQVATNSMTTSREQNGGTAGKKSRTFLKRSNAAKSLPAGETAVDWDEDLRVDEDEDKELSSPTKRPTSAASRSTRTGPKKPAGAKKAPKVSSPGKKGIKKVKSKDNVMQAASVKVSLAATRPRRAAANVSYGEQSEQEEQSQDRVHGRNDTVNHAETDQTSATATFLNTDNDHVLRKAQSVDDQNPGDASETPFGGDEPLFIPTEAAVKIPRSSEEAPAAIEPITNPKKYGADTDPSGPGKASFRDQKEKESKLGHDLSERTERPEVEAVDDSHPMDKDQRVDAIGAARKSFGSALMDVMKETGMRPIATPHPDETRTKPFGDKASFIDSVKTALMQSPSKPGTHAPSLDRTRHVHGSDRIKHVQTPSTSEQESYAATWRRPANGTSQSVRTGSQQPLEELASHQRLDEGVGETTQTQTANAAMPTAASERLKSPSETLPFPQQRKPDTSQAKPTREDHTSRSNDMNAGSSRSTRSIELPEPSAKSDSPAPRLPLGDKATEINNNGRKRGSPPQFEKPQQTKRARKADPGPKRSKINDKSMQSPAQLLLPTVNVTGHSPKTKVGVPKPSAAESKKIIQSDEASGVLHTEKKQTPAQIGVWQRDHPEVRSSANASKLIPSKAQTPNHLTVVGDIPTLTDDQLHRKAQIVDFSARGPRNQGVSSSGRREHAVGQASSVPTETGKHLAFKNLRTDLKAVGRPGKAGANSSLLFGSHGKREVQFSFSDRESTDDGIYADEESAEDAAPAPAISDLENGKSASQTSKVDENGSPRLRLPKISRPSLLSNDSTALQDPRDLDESVGTTSVPECSESEELQSNESSNFDLEAAVSKYTAANVQMTATLKDTRSRPSIGLGKLLNDSFPQASKSIETNVFKRAILADATAPSRSFQKSKSTDKPNGDRSLGRTVVTQGSPNKAMTADHDDTTSFDIDELNVSVAHEQPSSAASFRVRRLRSGTTPSPGGEAPRPDGSPASFNTRLAKMIMPPPARKEQSRVDVAEEDESGLHVGRDRSIMIDAETTLVNGEAFVKESHLSSPHVQQRLSSSSSDEEEGAPVLVSQQVPPKDIHGERRLWNQKVAETKQTLQETLQQVSQVSLSRRVRRTILTSVETSLAFLNR